MQFYQSGRNIQIVSYMEHPRTVKIIQLKDQYEITSHEYPYILSIKSKIRFRLRSTFCFHHEPILLVEKLQSFDYMLPLKEPIDLASTKTSDNFIIIKGKITKDGAWETDLPSFQPGVISFQLVFRPAGTNTSSVFGTYDKILLCQNKFDLRRLRSMTVFPRCIGSITEWVNFFKSQNALGYNTFHLAPIQQTGASNSYYSLKSHLQLSDYLFSGTQQQKNAQLLSVLEVLKKQGMVFIIDIILNHISFDSEWIQSEPEAVFTVDNTPMLYTAFLVDRTIFEWGEEVKEMMSFDTQLTEDILSQIETNLRSRIEGLEIQDYFQLSPQLYDIMLVTVPPRKPSDNIFAKDPVELIEEFLENNCSTATEQRLGVTVEDIAKWESLNIAYEENDLKLAIQAFNSKWTNRVQNQWIPEIVRNTMNDVRYNYFDNSNRSFDDPYPLVNKYFSRVDGTDGEFYAINNGWVGGNDSTELFVTSQEYYYLRRRVNVWGDLIRIRYGKKPSDSPAAWKHMLQYVRQMAKYFDGFRMDNLHGTPIYVARHLIREARKVNPSLIVFAELFTSNEAQTAFFVRQIGINSTLKEAQHMLNGDAFVYNFHKRINFTSPYLGTFNKIFIENGEKIKYATRKQPIPLVYDLTHDNETYASKNILILQTPISYLLSLIGTFTGSCKGFDQFYSKKIQVTELRQLYVQDYSYPPVLDKSEVHPYIITLKNAHKCQLVGSWNGWKQSAPLTYHKGSDSYYITLYLEPGEYQYKFRYEKEWILDKTKPNNGNNHLLKVTPIRQPKAFYRNLQALRQCASRKAEMFYHFKEYHVYNIGNIVIVIREPIDHIECICIIVNLSKEEAPLIEQIGLTGNILDCDIWLQSQLSVYQGLTTQTQICHSKNINQFFEVAKSLQTGNDVLRAPFLPPGFSCFIHCRKNSFHREIITSIEDILSKPISLPPLGPLEINGLFFNCLQEEEHLWGQSNYVIPQDHNHQLVYAGFAGVFQTVLRVKRTKNLNEGVYQNLREGNWLMDYYLNRCRRYKHLSSFVEYLEKVFGLIGSLPRYLVPRYFTEFIYKLMLAVKAQTKRTTDFEQSLVLAVNQFINYFPSCPLPDKTLIAAGLPHFSVGWSRCWGRDTFISSDLLRIYPNIFREVILQFGSALRHGLIPNLLDEGRRPRYNCRDACWWYIRAIGQYIEETNDYQILKNKVQMLFHSSDKLENERLSSQGKKKIMLLEQIVHQIFQSHANGILFREWNSGYQIDANMNSEGFNISLEVDGDTGFIIGGNVSNCLTWMDKMGSSAHAGTKGVPATPRAGAPVELVGLLYSCLRIFENFYNNGYYSFNVVQFQGQKVELGRWADKIATNFDHYFYLKEKHPEESRYVKGIYKDVVFSPLHYEQERFRPNALIALAVAPEICDPLHARTYIRKVQQHLIKHRSIGVGTLSDHHNFYSPFYDNSDDSSDQKIAHGFSYHNGPEWVWLYGFYLTAKINFEREKLSKKKMMTLLQNHIAQIEKSEWQSFSELTNRNGEPNKFSCKAQAWSVSAILMAMRHIESLPDDR